LIVLQLLIMTRLPSLLVVFIIASAGWRTVSACGPGMARDVAQVVADNEAEAGSNATEADHHAVEIKDHPVEQDPIESEHQPLNPEHNPVEPKTNSTNPEHNPVHLDPKRTKPEHDPVEPDHQPADLITEGSGADLREGSGADLTEGSGMDSVDTPMRGDNGCLILQFKCPFEADCIKPIEDGPEIRTCGDNLEYALRVASGIGPFE
ncbi:hypothetical protein PMAYCL1PPCAC_17203, partial [Pristionchus mayeri]